MSKDLWCKMEKEQTPVQLGLFDMENGDEKEHKLAGNQMSKLTENNIKGTEVPKNSSEIVGNKISVPLVRTISSSDRLLKPSPTLVVIDSPIKYSLSKKESKGKRIGTFMKSADGRLFLFLIGTIGSSYCVEASPANSFVQIIWGGITLVFFGMLLAITFRFVKDSRIQINDEK